MSLTPSLPLPVPKALAQLRRERCLSQQQLADLAGLAMKTVWSIERGLTTYPSARTMRKLAAALGLAEADLRRRLGMSPPMPGASGRCTPPMAGASNPVLREPAGRVAALMEALLARWDTLTPAQQQYAETICWHLYRALYPSLPAAGQEEGR